MSELSIETKRSLRFGVKYVLLAAFSLALVLVVVTWAAGILAKSNLIQRYPAPGQLVDVNGYRLHINCSGQGSPTVILAAGLDDFSIMWSLVQPEVAKFTRVCAYDRAGLGWSESSSRSRTSATMVKELHTLLRNARVDPPYVLVGHSFGGVLVQLYSYAFPDEIAGVVLVDAAPGDLFKRIPVWGKLIEQKIGLFRTLAPLSSFGLLALMPDTIPNRGLPESALAQYRAIAASTAYFDMGIAENEMFEKNLAEMRTVPISNLGELPLIVISEGAWEPLPGISEAENLQACQAWQAMQSELVGLSTNGRQVVAEKSGHFIQLQQPELVIDAIRASIAATRQ